MALKTNPGGRESDSFVQLSEVAAIIAEYFPDDGAKWTALSAAQQEVRLRLGAQVMGMLPVRGRRVFCGQNLCFPRTCQSNVSVIPDAVKVAQVMLAFSVVHRGLANRPDIEEDASGPQVKSVSLGGLLSVSFTDGPLKGGNMLDQFVRSAQFPIYAKMKPYLSQIRGGTILNTDDDDYVTCSTTTTTTTVTTTSTTSTSTTT